VSPPELFRAVVPVADIDAAVGFYERVLQLDGQWVGAGRVYLRGRGAILVCLDRPKEGDGPHPGPNRGHLYFAVDDLDACYERAQAAGDAWLEGPPTQRGWGERSFYARDPFDNPLCFVHAPSRYLGLSDATETATAEK
jgi:catechol 2,3-dioxygenase-like lactoylglutathione lyase family enzyme